MAFMMGIIASAYGGPLAEFPLKEDSIAPFLYVNKQLIYVFAYLIVMRYFVQSLPVLNIKALLLTPLLKTKIVRFSLLKTVFTYFNILPLFFLIPFSFLLAQTGKFDIIGLIFWNINILGLIYVTNFFNFLLNNKDKLLYAIGGILALIKGLEYYSIVDFTEYSEQFFYLFYSQPYVDLELLRAQSYGRLEGIEKYTELLKEISKKYLENKTAIDLNKTISMIGRKWKTPISLKASKDFKLIFIVNNSDLNKSEILKINNKISTELNSINRVSFDVYNNKNNLIVIHDFKSEEKAEDTALKITVQIPELRLKNNFVALSSQYKNMLIYKTLDLD